MTDEATSIAPIHVSARAALRAVLATDFASLIEYTFGVLRPGMEFRPNWHIEAMAYKLSQVATGEVKRLIITLPPRNLKSICASVALPAWFLGHHPSERVVAVSYSAELAKTHARLTWLAGTFSKTTRTSRGKFGRCSAMQWRYSSTSPRFGKDLSSGRTSRLFQLVLNLESSRPPRRASG